MGRKNFYMDRTNKIDIPFSGDNWMDKGERFGSNNWIYLHNSIRIYRKQMGEITLRLINWAGFTGIIIGIIANLNNILAVFLGVGSLMFVVFKSLKER